jgi:hypothetical protein
VGCAPPFSRRARDERAGEPDEWAVSGVYDFIAREFGWGRDYVDDVLSDEQLVAYLDAAQERLEAEQRTQFDSWVEAIRAGTIFAHDDKQYGRWRTRPRKNARQQRGLTGAALEQAVMRIASIFPEQVIGGSQP